MARILVIEDEKDLVSILEFNLRQAGHETFAAFSALGGLNAARMHNPHLILLDRMLPDLSGTEVLTRLKSDSSTAKIPILFLTAKGEEADRVAGLELGADDYIVKPFSIRELILRIAAVLKRNQSLSDTTARVEFGLLKINREAYRVWVDGVEIELTPIEFNLLLTLYDRRSRVQSREQLLGVVWKNQRDVTNRTVDTHIKRLRVKLKKAAEYIETVRGVGYRFT